MITSKCKSHKKNTFIMFFTMTVILIITVIASLTMGKYAVETGDVFRIFRNRITGVKSSDLAIAEHIIINVRLPRIIMAGMVGCGLAVSGASLQGTFRNPLVSPDIMGVCSGAGFGAALGILLLWNNFAGIVALSFTFGIISVVLVFAFVGVERRGDVVSLILGGIISASIFNGLISLTKYMADTRDKLPAISFWLMGSFSSADYEDVIISIFPLTIGVVGMILFRWKLNLLSLGDEDAYMSGINPKRTRYMIIIFSTLTISACVSVSGIVGWVGLVIPHICRKLVGDNHSLLIPACCFMGAAFMIFVDMVARTISGAEIPVGILTSLIGAPFFAFLYRRNKGERRI